MVLCFQFKKILRKTTASVLRFFPSFYFSSRRPYKWLTMLKCRATCWLTSLLLTEQRCSANLPDRRRSASFNHVKFTKFAAWNAVDDVGGCACKIRPNNEMGFRLGYRCSGVKKWTRVTGTRARKGSHGAGRFCLVFECCGMVQKQYKIWRHDRVAHIEEWKLCKEYNLDHAKKWYDQKPKCWKMIKWSYNGAGILL